LLRKTVSGVMLTLLLIGMLALSFNIQTVKASGTIYIRADGSIDPSTAPISTVDNVTYILTGDITSDANGIVVERNNTILDGAGYKILGTDNGFGIVAGDNVTIRNMEIASFGVGIALVGSSNNIVGNNFTNNGLMTFGYQNKVENNFVNSKPLVYLQSTSDHIINDAGQVILVNCSGIRVENLDLSNVIPGVELIETVNSNILNNRFAYSQYSIELYKSSNNTISGNDISNITRKIYFWEGSGIDLSGSNGNRIFGNNITGYEYSCISLWGSSGNSIYANNLEKCDISLHDSQLNSMVGNNLSNEAGFFFWNSSANSIIGNTITSTSPSQYAVMLNFHSSGNRIYHNNFVNDTYPVQTDEEQNFWDDGYPSGGNYWSDYNGSDVNRDGVGDEPYLAQRPYDPPCVMNYPLMGMFYSFNTSLGCEVSVVSNSTIKDFEYFQSNSTIKMHVCNMTTNQEFGFVRICIPHTLMNETYHVTVDGAEPHYINYTLYDNGTNRWIYFSYQHSTLEIVIIPEFPSFLILPLFILTTLIATILLKKNRKLKFQQLS